MEEIANMEMYRSYLFFWTGQLFSLLGSMVVFFVITWWITDVYESAILLAIGSFLYVLMMTLFMPIAGVIADKVNRKVVIVAVDSLQAFATFLLIMLFQFGISNISIVFVFISLRSVFQAFHVPTVNAIIPTMVPKDKLTRINGINFLFTGVVQLLAPFIGAMLLVFLSMYMILWVDIITFFIALIPLLLVTIPSVNHVNNAEEVTKESSFIEEFKLGLKTLKLVPGLITMIILTMLLNFLVKPLDTLFPLFIKVDHGGGAVHLAIAEMIFTGGMIAGAVLTSLKKNWNNKIRAIFISIIIALIGYMILAIAPLGPFYFMGIGGVILGFNLPIINSLYQTFLQNMVPADKIGRVTSIDYTFSSAISPLSSLLSGPLAELIGIPALFFFSGLIGVICTMAFWSFSGIGKVDIDSKSVIDKIDNQINNLEI